MQMDFVGASKPITVHCIALHVVGPSPGGTITSQPMESQSSPLSGFVLGASLLASLGIRVRTTAPQFQYFSSLPYSSSVD